MILFRTCSSKSIIPALKFVKRTKNIQAVAKFIGATEMIDEVFLRPLPIEKKMNQDLGLRDLTRTSCMHQKKGKRLFINLGITFW